VGFLNYLFASGLILILFAVWILMARRNPLHRAAVFSLLMSGMFFFHIIATAVLCICIVAYEAGQSWLARDRQLPLHEQLRTFFKDGLITVAPFAPVLVFWSFSPTGTNEEALPDGRMARGPSSDDHWVQWSTWHNDFDYIIQFSLGSPREKLDGPLTLVESGDWFALYKINKPGVIRP
jgi:hypothetical protein